MSNYLAIATVTETLRANLEKSLQDETGLAEVSVRVSRPEAPNGDTPAGVGLFLYQVGPNGAWRNTDLPTRTSRGDSMIRPRAALDLFYLLSFVGNESNLEPQRLLGSAVRYLHARPVLSRDSISAAIDSAAGDTLDGSDLVEQAEAVRFTPVPLSLDELSKIWSVFFQVPYQLSVAYQASVVLIEGTESPAAALPVRTRGIYALPFLYPEIVRVLSRENADDPFQEHRAIHTGDELAVEGTNLRGDVTALLIDDITVALAPEDVRGTRIIATIPETVPAGVRTVRVVHSRRWTESGELRRAGQSNTMPFVLRPRITDAPAIEGSGEARTLRVEFSPPAKVDQDAALLLNEYPAPPEGEARAARAYVIEPAGEIEGEEASELSFPLTGVEAGTYAVRVRVDGADSLPDYDADPPHPSPRVTM